MFHGIYLKSRPKSKWHLVAIAPSQEAAVSDMNSALQDAHALGLHEAEVAEQVFDSAFWIPHYLNDVKERKPMYN